MEPLKTAMMLWPQALMAILLVLVAMNGIINNGKKINDPLVRGKEAIWISFMIAAVLGAGGFWHG